MKGISLTLKLTTLESLSPLESLFPYILVLQMKLCALLFYYHKNYFSHVHTNREYKGHACATTHLISAIKLYVVKHELKFGYLHIFRFSIVLVTS